MRAIHPNIAVTYYPFGMLMPGRTYSSEAYSWGFNGKEKDDEVSDQGNCYDYGFRIYNSRLGKFLSVDPLSKSYPWYTPYQFTGNKPIWAIDLDGLEEVFYLTKYRSLFKNFFQLIQSDKELSPVVWDPISKSEKKQTHKIYFTCITSASMNILKVESTTRGLTNGPGSTIDLAREAFIIVDYYIRTHDDNKFNDGIDENTKIRMNNMKFLFNQMGFDAKEINQLAKDYKDNKQVYFVILNSDVYNTEDQTKETLSKAAKTAVHEINLHLINNLNNIKKTPEKEHEEGFGKNSTYTPEDSEIPPNSILGKLHKKVDVAIEKYEIKKYPNKK
jgi:RHS repeat-associated protein